MFDDDDTTPPAPRRVQLLVELQPRWLDDGSRSGKVVGSRFGMGVSFICPGHPHERHRLALYFVNPLDGDPPKPSLTLYYRTGSTFRDLTLSEGRGAHVDDELVSVEGHWEGFLHSGQLIDALPSRH